MTEKQDLIARLKLVAQGVHGFELDTVNEAIELIEQVELQNYKDRVEGDAKPSRMKQNEQYEFVQMMLRDYQSVVIGYIAKTRQVRFSYVGNIWDRIHILGTLQTLHTAALSKILTKPEFPPSPDVVNAIYQQFTAYAATCATQAAIAPLEFEGNYIDADTGKSLNK